LSPRLPTVAGDRDRLLQVVWNLLSNAVKFTEAGGRVTVCVAADRGLVRLSVSDTGQGIAPEFLPQVFERFKQADNNNHGQISLDEAQARMPRLAERFTTLDADKNGMLSKEELRHGGRKGRSTSQE
jgi:signal transduction histidine kinase